MTGGRSAARAVRPADRAVRPGARATKPAECQARPGCATSWPSECSRAVARYHSYARAFLARLASLCPQVVFGETSGGSHFIQLDVPGQVDEMLERFVRGLP